MKPSSDGSEPPSRTDAFPLASVIVVCWNAEDVLGRCLKHLLAQDYPNYEIIVVDDGSEDDTLAVAEAARLAGELTIVRSGRNRGCPHARNLGLRHAKGEIVAFIDADGFAATSWLRHIVAAFDGDETVGGVASTVFFDANPLVINGAGGIVNRQGWAADLEMSQSYEQAEIATEALYPMGCGMALRRSALERVGPFDDRMLNYYDDVDYGTRLWRAGYRVVVAPDGWIDHGYGRAGGESAHKQMLCERHRMRIVLKHAPARSLARWAVYEARGVMQAQPARRAQKLNAMAWNMRHLPSVLGSRWRMRKSPQPPDRLIDPSRGDGFPAGVPPPLTPCPERASSSIEMARSGSERQLIHGWFPVEEVDGRSYRWAGVRAAALVHLETPARRLRLNYAHVPVDTGGIDLLIRRLGSSDPLTPVWTTHLQWAYIARSVENHPVALPAGDYEVVFNARSGWLEPPLKTRSLSLALASLSLAELFEIDPDGLDMASPSVDQQLVSGWFESEESEGRHYRWASGQAAAVVRITESVSRACLCYRMPPVPSHVQLALSPVGQEAPAWSSSIVGPADSWHRKSFELDLPAGDYVASFKAARPWSNPHGRDVTLWPENRLLGVAVASLLFDAA